MTTPAVHNKRTWTSWRAAGFFAIAAPALLLALRPIDDVDIFWQVRMGQALLHSGFGLTEPFSFRFLGEPVSCLGWLGQVLFALAHRLAGWPAVQALHVAAYTTAFAFIWARLGRIRVGAGAAVLAVLLMFLACMSNCSERPQTFAFLAFSGLLWISAGRWPSHLYWVVVVPLLVVWQNVHPSVPVAAAVLGLQAVGRYADERWGRAANRGLWRRPLATAIVAAGAVFCTPTGWAILELSARNARLSRWLGIGEWQPAHGVWSATAGFWLVLLIAGLAWIRSRMRPAWRELLPVLLLTAAALCWSRMIVFWAVLSAPTLARLLHRSGLSMLRRPRDTRLSPAAARRVNAGVTITLSLLVAVNPWLRPHLPWIPASRRVLFDPQFPLVGIERLRETLGAGRIYNYREWGGMLAFAGAPQWRVAIDGRIYRYDQPVWESYTAVALGDDVYRQVFERLRPAALFLRPDHDRRLIERLRTDPRWHDYYHDANCHIFVSLDHALAAASRWNASEES